MPIIPEYLYRLNHPNETLELLDFSGGTTTTLAPAKPQPLLPPPAEPNRVYPVVQLQPITTTTEDPQLRIDKYHEHIAAENIEVGIMFGSKALVQVFTNPWVGPMTNRFEILKPKPQKSVLS